METEATTPRSPLMASMPRGSRKFHSPTYVMIEEAFSPKLKFVGLILEEEYVVDTTPEKPISTSKQVEKEDIVDTAR